MNTFKRSIAAALLGTMVAAFGLGTYVRQNAMQLTLAAVLISFGMLGAVDPAMAIVGVALMAGNAPFPITPEYTAIALAYNNRTLIADEVLPRSPVGKKEFVYYAATQADAYTVPDTKVARRSSPNQVEFSATSTTGMTQDYGLDDTVPQDDIDNAPPNFDPLARATATLTNLILLDREIRVANLIFATGTYTGSLQSTLSGTSQWSDYTNSDPVAAIMNALDLPLVRPNIAVLGRVTFSKLRMHPKVVQAVLGVANTGTGASAGAVSRRAIADLLELEDVLVGESFLNSAKKGQTPSYARAWGKHAAFLYRDRNALAGGQTVTFGYTAQFGTRVAGSWSVKENAGIKGGTKVRVGESVAEVITANDTGYFFQNAVA